MHNADQCEREDAAGMAPTGAPPDVSVILVNHNGQGDLAYCLPALAQTTGVRFEVLLVDNASTDGSRDWVAANHPSVRLLALPENVGFGEANRRAIALARGRRLALLNTDTEVEPGWLAALSRALDSDKAMAAACSELRFRAAPGIVNARGGGMTWIGLGYDRDLGAPVDATCDGLRDVFFPTAAAALFRREPLEAVGGFDPAFFMYHEDVDLGWRLWLAGYRIVFCPASVVLHTRGAATRRKGGKTWSNELGFRHALRTMLKNYRPWTAAAGIAGLGLLLLFSGRIRLLASAWQWNRARWHDTRIERRRVQQTRRRGDLFLLARLVRFPWPLRPSPGKAVRRLDTH